MRTLGDTACRLHHGDWRVRTEFFVETSRSYGRAADRAFLANERAATRAPIAAGRAGDDPCAARRLRRCLPRIDASRVGDERRIQASEFMQHLPGARLLNAHLLLMGHSARLKKITFPFGVSIVPRCGSTVNAKTVSAVSGPS